MSSGPEHYTEAERLLQSQDLNDIARGIGHALLADAAARALTPTDDSTGGIDYHAWRAVAHSTFQEAWQ